MQELAKIIAKKRRRYPDEQKLAAYLAWQGFDYDDIKQALQKNDNLTSQLDNYYSFSLIVCLAGLRLAKRIDVAADHFVQARVRALWSR